MIVDRELLLEIGSEEMPAGWLPGLTQQIGEVYAHQLQLHRIPPEGSVETFSTPRRLTVHVARVPERQTDFEELVTGPPVTAAFKPDGTPTPAATGFASKQGVDIASLERLTTPKGEYLAYRRRLRGKATIDVLPHVLAGTLRALSFPKAMHWDAVLGDNAGELLFGRPIRWILYLYGGRVVPFSISRTAAAQSDQVQDVVSGAVTYGHRFLTTSGRAGRAIKVRSFEEYRTRLLEHFVILERQERHDKIARELDARAVRLKTRVSHAVHGDSGLLEEVPDLVEYPSVIAGTFASEFTETLPQEVLTTTLIHHQHYFPVEGDDGRLKPAFLAVINTEPDDERSIARNAERVVTARLRDAKFFWDADRRAKLESRVDRLATLEFHKKLGSYKQKAERIELLAEWMALEVFGASEEDARLAARAARLAKVDLTTDMVREFTELQGTMGGIYAREEGLPEQVWKAIYFHYLPVSVEASAKPEVGELGRARAAWAAVSLADKLDTVVGLFAAGERPTGSRDPFGLRRAAQGAVKILVDFPKTSALSRETDLRAMIERAHEGYGPQAPESAAWKNALSEFMAERVSHLFERSGFQVDEIRAAVPQWWSSPASALRRVEALAHARESADFAALAVLFKRIKNITREFEGALDDEARSRLVEPAEAILLRELDARWPVIRTAVAEQRFEKAMHELVAFSVPVDRFFVDVLVMSDDKALRHARLALLTTLRSTILTIADIAEMAPTTES